MRFVVPFYDIDVTLIQVESSKDAKAVERNLKPLDAPKDEVDEVVDAVRRSAYDGGDTFREFRYKRMVVIFYEFHSDIKRAEVYSHEKRHIEDRILQYAGVNDIESAGMLAGYLGVQFYKFERL